MVHKEDIVIAYNTIKGNILKTPLIHSPKLSALSGANVYIKMEHLQVTSSFKIRGVLTKIDSLSKTDFDKIFVAASTGNHAAAFGYASKKYGFEGKLFLPENVEEEKLKGISNYALDIVLYGRMSKEVEMKATQYAEEVNGVLIHPYNDIEIIKGQGTIAVEIEAQLPQVDSIIVPIGGGGLASGIASYFSENDGVKVIGCQPENASEMHDSIKVNKIVTPSILTTIADASAGGIEEESLTFTICKKHLSTIELIAEEEIKKAVAFLYKYHDTTVEPTAALPVAALLKGSRYHNKNVILVITGKKINKKLLTKINEEYGNCY